MSNCGTPNEDTRRVDMMLVCGHGQSAALPRDGRTAQKTTLLTRLGID
jgi:hypothetical protein